jgi:hypothetical protein
VVKHFATAVALWVLFASARASAQPAGELPADARARALLEEGLAAFGDREFARAIDAFQRGHAIEPRRVFLFAWAQAERLSGRCDRASPLYRRFLEQEPPRDQAARASEGLARCASPHRPAVEPEPRIIVAPSPPPPRPEPPFWTDPVGDVFAGAGVVAFVTSGVLLGVAEAAASDAGDARSLAAWQDGADRADSARVWAAVAAGAGVALVAVAVVRWLTHDRRDEPPVEARAVARGRP